MRVFFVVATVFLACVGVGTAHADSDGYYCIGSGYLAYQFGFAAPPVGPHRLFVLRVGDPSGVEPPAVLDLPQFQVSAMLCGDRSIQMFGWDAIYTIELDASSGPVRYDSTPWFDRGRLPPQFRDESRNLGKLNPSAASLNPVRVLLRAVADGGQDLLEMSSNTTSSEPCAELMMTTRVVRIDPEGREIQQLQIFQGRRNRECGD